MSKYFGTDGFRGQANVRLTANEAYKIGRFLGRYRKGEKRPRILVGKDPRRSSYMLEYSLVSGITASGADAYLMHVTTTPSISYIAAREGFDAAVMISASHNLFADNGIKIFDGNGEKLGENVIEKIERYLDDDGDNLPLAVGGDIGKVEDYFVGRNRYMSFLMSVPSNSFKGYKIAIDAANGSGYMLARTVFSSLGAKVFAINDCPDGLNINFNSGATNVSALCATVKQNSCDFGFAFDGDGDRCIAVDENGEVVDGDKILFALALEMKERQALSKNTVVSTTDSNAALKTALSENGITLETTDVGDRFVSEKLKEGYSLGGERSGHIIVKKFLASGDGILTALLLTELAIEKKCPFSALFCKLKLLPEIRMNVDIESFSEENFRKIEKDIEKLKEKYRAKKLLVRKSGTENVIRITVGAEFEDIARECAEKLCELIKENR